MRSSGPGRPPLRSKRGVLNAIFCQLRAGGAWHLLPHDLPPWRTVCKQFEAWREDGAWERLLASNCASGADGRDHRPAVRAYGR